MTVVAGSTDGTTGTSFTVKKIILHPNYDATGDSYNFALLKVKGSFTWGEDVGNATLPSSDPESGAVLVAAGYGDTVSHCACYKLPQKNELLALENIIFNRRPQNSVLYFQIKRSEYRITVYAYTI